MTLDDDISRLSRTRPFNLLPRDALQLIAFSAEKQKLAANQQLFEEGDPADSGYFVLSGSIALSVRNHKGERTRVVGVGALIGENAMMAEVARPSTRARQGEFGRIADFPADLPPRARRVSEGGGAHPRWSCGADAENVAVAGGIARAGDRAGALGELAPSLRRESFTKG